jgi:hypothetical protein
MRMPPRMAAPWCPVMTTSSGARLAEPVGVVADWGWVIALAALGPERGARRLRRGNALRIAP